MVEAGSFSGAARRLGIIRSTVSRQMAALEQAPGGRLLNRATRRLSLTEAGCTDYESYVRILAGADAGAPPFGGVRYYEQAQCPTNWRATRPLREPRCRA